jgi:hypothetical protein
MKPRKFVFVTWSLAILSILMPKACMYAFLCEVICNWLFTNDVFN